MGLFAWSPPSRIVLRHAMHGGRRSLLFLRVHSTYCNVVSQWLVTIQVLLLKHLSLWRKWKTLCTCLLGREGTKESRKGRRTCQSSITSVLTQSAFSSSSLVQFRGWIYTNTKGSNDRRDYIRFNIFIQVMSNVINNNILVIRERTINMTNCCVYISIRYLRNKSNSLLKRNI